MSDDKTTGAPGEEAPSPRKAPVDQAKARIGQLLRTYRKHAPVLIRDVGRGDAEDWRVLGPALLARAAYALDTVRLLAEREVDAALVTRTLYETSLTFAWIAIDPQSHVFRWLRTDREERLKALRELEGFGLTNDPKIVREYELDVGLAKQPMASVFDMAREADQHWTRALPEFHDGSGTYEFRGLYCAIYRNASGSVHPRQNWLTRFVHSNGPGPLRIADPVERETRSMVTIAPFAFAGGLLVSAARLGWPPADQVISAFDEETFNA